ncbi:hypothetical protein [Sulfitobacter faviae]|uniref:hypothetical protein n=1 Tax=Sulfitobacter faviae TaxID=1775881 RepID=UPI0031BA8172
MHIKTFGVEMWMNEFENHCRYNLAETCVDSITLGELIDMADVDNSVLGELREMRMGYGAIEGSDRLRDAVAGLYENQARENVLTTHGTIGPMRWCTRRWSAAATMSSPSCRPTSSITRSPRASVPRSNCCTCAPRTAFCPTLMSCAR